MWRSRWHNQNVPSWRCKWRVVNFWGEILRNDLRRGDDKSQIKLVLDHDIRCNLYRLLTIVNRKVPQFRKYQSSDKYWALVVLGNFFGGRPNISLLHQGDFPDCCLSLHCKCNCYFGSGKLFVLHETQNRNSRLNDDDSLSSDSLLCNSYVSAVWSWQ